MFDRLRDLSADVRGRIYSLLVPLQVALVSFGLLDDSHAALWISVVASILGFTVAGANSTSTWRTWLYGVVAAAQPVLVGYGVATGSQVASVVAVVSAALGLSVAAVKTPSLG
ncbi:phage holin [Nocardia africana]